MHRYAALLAACLAGCMPASPRPAPTPQVLLSDDFDGENREAPDLMYAGFQHWRVEGGTVDLVGAGSDWDFQPGNGLYVDLDGDRPNGVTFEPGILASREVFRLRPGVYELRFHLAGSRRGDRNRVEVRLGSAFAETIALDSDAPFREYVRRIRLGRGQDARLTFDHEGADGYGLLLDRVRLARLR